MTALLVPLAFWDFLNAIMTPLYAAVSAILVGAHTVWAPLFGSGSGVTWVMSIVSLTVVIRTLLIPLFVKQINSARNMQLVQPKLKALQDKYGSDREKLGQETMKLYQEEGVNPAASCLPLLLQMPIFIALFNVLNGVSRGNAIGYFFEKNPDLVSSLRDSHVFGASLAGTFFPISPFGATQVTALVLMLAMTGVLFMTQLQLMSKNMPPEALTGPFAQQQKMMLYLFPIMYLVGGVAIPIGVLVYWLVSNVWTLGQQYLLIHNNPTPNTPAYIEWEERMIRKGKDPKKIQAEQMAKRQKRPVAPSPVVAAATAAGETTEGGATSGKPTVQRQQVQRQQIQRQQPRAASRSTRKKTPGAQGPADTNAEA
ncbi:MAG: membrane protein insertase YidC [Actinobacteria bacterium]|nr:membrane protein insertase YidC [Actinomycetota bacterium]